MGCAVTKTADIGPHESFAKVITKGEKKSVSGSELSDLMSWHTEDDPRAALGEPLPTTITPTEGSSMVLRQFSLNMQTCRKTQLASKNPAEGVQVFPTLFVPMSYGGEIGFVSLTDCTSLSAREWELLETLFKKTLPATQKETLNSNNHTLATNAPNALREGTVSPRQHVAAERSKTDSFNIKNVSLLGGDRQLENSQKASSVALNINPGSFAHHTASGLGRLIDPRDRDGSFHQSGVQKPTLSTQPTVSASPQPVSIGQSRLNNWLDGFPPSSVPHLPGELRPDNATPDAPMTLQECRTQESPYRAAMGSNGPPLSEHESLHAVRLQTRSENIGLKYTQKHGAVYVVGTEENSAASASELPEGYVVRVNGVETPTLQALTDAIVAGRKEHPCVLQVVIAHPDHPPPWVPRQATAPAPSTVQPSVQPSSQPPMAHPGVPAAAFPVAEPQKAFPQPPSKPPSHRSASSVAQSVADAGPNTLLPRMTPFSPSANHTEQTMMANSLHRVRSAPLPNAFAFPSDDGFWANLQHEANLSPEAAEEPLVTLETSGETIEVSQAWTAAFIDGWHAAHPHTVVVRNSVSEIKMLADEVFWGFFKKRARHMQSDELEVLREGGGARSGLYRPSLREWNSIVQEWNTRREGRGAHPASSSSSSSSYLSISTVQHLNARNSALVSVPRAPSSVVSVSSSKHQPSEVRYSEKHQQPPTPTQQIHRSAIATLPPAAQRTALEHERSLASGDAHSPRRYESRSSGQGSPHGSPRATQYCPNCSPARQVHSGASLPTLSPASHTSPRLRAPEARGHAAHDPHSQRHPEYAQLRSISPPRSPRGVGRPGAGAGRQYPQAGHPQNAAQPSQFRYSDCFNDI